MAGPTRRRFTAMFIVTAALAAAGCDEPARGSAAGDDISGDLVIFHAGSLSVPLREVSALFMHRHPNVVVKAEAAGSRRCARKISQLHRRCDILASADCRVVENLLMPDHARFNIRFALNEMVVAYTPRSGRRETITAENWHEILLRDDVAVGRSDPDCDPCGYRTLMMFQLAERHYGLDGLAAELADACDHVRPKETDLLPLLEIGELDYLLIYRSVARQHGLNVILLPDEINLKSPALAAEYRSATVSVTGKRPGRLITRTGEPIVYSLTIPTDAANPKAAAAWVALLLSPAGRAIMERNGQPCLRPPLADGWEHLPHGLRPLCRAAETGPPERRNHAATLPHTRR